MEFSITIVMLFVIIIALIIGHYCIHKTRSGRLVDKIPGPLCLPVIGNLIDVTVPLEQLWIALRKYARDYSNLYKIWVVHLPIVSILQPDDIQILLSSQKNLTKSTFYEFLHPWLNKGLLTSTGSKWRERRKTLTPAFHYQLLHDFVGVFVETSERIVNTLKEEGGEVIKDVVPFLGKFTLNAICETAMGTTMRDNDPSQESYRAAVKKMGGFIFYRGARPWLKSDWIFLLTQTGREQAKTLKILHHFTMNIIEKRKKFHEETGGEHLKIFSSGNEVTSGSSYDTSQNKKRLAMLDLLIAVQKEQGIIDDLGIREEVDTFVFEGHDTTNISMSFTVLLLAENKEAQARARAEIGAVLKESNGKLGMAELQNLTYLDRCIKEALRLFPAVPHVSRQLTEDLQLRNFLLPSGITAAIHIWDLHRDPNLWPNPEVFDPDRFLPEKIEGRHLFSYLPFSAGPRNCIGQKYALLEFKAFIGQILHNFYLESIVKTSTVNLLPDLVLKPVYPLNVKFIPIK